MEPAVFLDLGNFSHLLYSGSPCRSVGLARLSGARPVVHDSQEVTTAEDDGPAGPGAAVRFTCHRARGQPPTAHCRAMPGLPGDGVLLSPRYQLAGRHQARPVRTVRGNGAPMVRGRRTADHRGRVDAGLRRAGLRGGGFDPPGPAPPENAPFLFRVHVAGPRRALCGTSSIPKQVRTTGIGRRRLLLPWLANVPRVTRVRVDAVAVKVAAEYCWPEAVRGRSISAR